MQGIPDSEEERLLRAIFGKDKTMLRGQRAGYDTGYTGYPPMNNDEIDSVARGRKIQAIQSYRSRTGVSLGVAKTVIDKAAEGLGETARRHSPEVRTAISAAGRGILEWADLQQGQMTDVRVKTGPIKRPRRVHYVDPGKQPLF